MEIVRNQKASSSTSQCSYQVFLSFRGEDTRKAFIDHLYTALVQAGFRTFRDDDGIERGEDIKFELQKAIQESRISVVVFSKHYASSSWCLDELVMILKHRRISGHVVLPVFYHVDPSHVRNQTESFEEAFKKHEERFQAKEGLQEEAGERKNNWKKKMEEWRATLREAADIAGMNLENGHESKFIQKIVKKLGDKLNCGILHVADHPIGMESQAKKIDLWLRDKSCDVSIAVICGMGGIGKTTLAKYVYNLHFRRFEAASFLLHVREESKRPSGLVGLQKQLLSAISNKKDRKINNELEGRERIENVMGCKRILAVLDDVDERQQFDNLIGKLDLIHRRSKIILTTRNKHLLKANEVYIFEVKELDSNKSLELFSWHAFGQDHPIERYFAYSQRVVWHCGGLPLALVVLGSSLSDKNLDIWKSALQKLKNNVEKDILEILKISYDNLDDHDKNLFLYIACLFIKRGNKDSTVRILDACDFCSERGMDNLIDRCLLTITQKILMMHQLLQDMGRYIVQQQSSNELGKCRLLGRHEDSFNVLRRKIGTKKIEGLYLDMHVLEKESWFNKTFCDLEIDAFARMENLILLMLNGVEIKGGYKEFPKILRWLSWHGYSQKSIPSDFSLESLVGLELQNSKLEQVWKGTRLLISLKVLNLSHSHGLRTTPNFTELPNLEDLILENCIRLVEVHESISELGRLVFLNLKGCKNLKKLSSKIGHLKSLEKLDLSGCSNLDHFPTELEKIKSLTMFNVDGIDIHKIQSTTSDVKPWSWLFNPFLLKPRKCPESICFSLASLASCMVSLSLSNCSMSYDDLTKILGRFSLLQDLDLSKNPISSLPETIKGLIGLRSLRLSHCTRLQSLPELPMGLELLDVVKCSSLEMITNLPNWTTYLALKTDGCEKLVEVQGIFKLEPIGNADAKIVNSLGLTELESMGSLEVYLWNNITCTMKKYLLQGLYECGIYNIFLPGSEVPGWSSNKRSGPSISFIVPSVTSLPDLKIQALNVYVLYAFADEDSQADKDSQGDNDFECMVIRNKTKGHTWHHSPSFICLPNANNDVVWLSHWMIAHQLMEVGDDVNLSVHLVDIFKVKEVGFQIVYDEYPVICSQHHNIYENVGDLSEYFSDVRDDNFPCHHQRHDPCC